MSAHNCSHSLLSQLISNRLDALEQTVKWGSGKADIEDWIVETEHVLKEHGFVRVKALEPGESLEGVEDR